MEWFPIPLARYCCRTILLKWRVCQIGTLIFMSEWWVSCKQRMTWQKHVAFHSPEFWPRRKTNPSSASSHQNMAGLTKSVGGLHLFFSIAFYGKFYGKCHLKCHHFPHWTCLKMANPGSSWAAHRRRGWEAQGWNLECEEERLEDVFLVGDEHCYPLVN